MGDFRLLICGLACLALAAVGLALVLRPDRHVAASRRRVAEDRALPLERLSHAYFAWAETALGYRLIGAAMTAAAATLFAFAFHRISQGA